MNDVKSFVLAHSLESLKKKVEEGNGTLRFKLNGEHVELNVNEDFFLSANDFIERQKQ